MTEPYDEIGEEWGIDPIMEPVTSESMHHLSAAICFAVSLVIARFILNTLVFRPLSLKLIHNLEEPRIVKCCESLWKLTYYGSTQLWVFYIMCLEPWAIDTTQYFMGWPFQNLSISLFLYYMCQCGFYIYSIAALLVWETRRKDFPIMMAHHIITTLLIAFSYSARFFRIGTVILALHDTSDVFMEAAKIFKYSERETGASICFGLFALSWFVCRLIIFPIWIIKASSYYSIDSFKLLDKFPIALYYAFNTMLLTLLVFHIYWWILIVSMIKRQLGNRGQVGEDIRSDSEEEE